MFSVWQLSVVAGIAVCHAIVSSQESQCQPPGQRVEVDGNYLHLLHLGSTDPAVAARPTVVIDHSLGGVEGYLLVRAIAPLAEVCLCDRPGYGWSDVSQRPMTSEERVRSLHLALAKAGVKPPYILVGNSLGSYHMRLYAHRFPEQVAGLILTDGLHEKALLKMPKRLRLMQALFWAGFVISTFASALGWVRFAAWVGIFEWIKPELRLLPTTSLRPVVRSFSRPQHWLTMAREISQLDCSGRQLQVANDFGRLPIVNIKARHFFRPTWLTKGAPLQSIESLREKMHQDLMGLSSCCTQLLAERSSHFVWIDQPEVIVEAVRLLLMRV